MLQIRFQQKKLSQKFKKISNCFAPHSCDRRFFFCRPLPTSSSSQSLCTWSSCSEINPDRFAADENAPKRRWFVLSDNHCLLPDRVPPTSPIARRYCSTAPFLYPVSPATVEIQNFCFAYGGISYCRIFFFKKNFRTFNGGEGGESLATVWTHKLGFLHAL